MKNKSGFSLIEILIYTAIIAIVGTFFGGILVSVTNIESKQTAGGEVNQQLSFVLNNIQRIIRDSSVIDMDSGVSTSTIVLRMEDPVKDKTLIYLNNNQIMLKEGDSSPVSLTSSAVKVDSLNFYKISSYPGHDSVQIDISMSYNTDNPAKLFTQKLSSAVARVSAATFDADLIPGATNNYDLGLSSLRWKNLYLSGDLTIGAKTTLGNLASDPTGADGMIYYNTVSKTYRAYSNGAWGNIGSGPWTLSGNNIYNTNTGNVGINTNNPGAQLEINGQLKITGGSPGVGKVLTSDASGLASWQSSLLPSGVIVLWSGSLSSIPSGWQVTDGTNGTPNLNYGGTISSFGGAIGTWTLSSNSLPQARAYFGIAENNNYIYVIGGQNTSGLETTSVYYTKTYSDGSIDPWTTSANPLPAGRIFLTAVVSNGYLYAIGGSEPGNWPARDTSVYYTPINTDGSIGTWLSATSLPAGRSQHGSIAASNGYIYVLGGYGSDNAQNSTVYFAKPETNGSISAWGTAFPTPLPTNIAANTNFAAAANGYLYAIGAYTRNMYFSKFNSDGSLYNWTTLSNSLPASASELTVAGSYLYAGNPTPPIYFAESNSADGTIGNWTTDNAFPVIRNEAGYITSNGNFFAIGGNSSGGIIQSSVYHAPFNSTIYYIMKL